MDTSKHKPHDIIRHLRDNGFHIFIDHTRNGVWLKAPTTKDGIERNWIKPGEVYPYGTVSARKLKKEFGESFQILPHGGSNYIDIYKGETYFIGVSHCSSKDQFNKRVGLSIALGRALVKMEKAGIFDRKTMRLTPQYIEQQQREDESKPIIIEDWRRD